MTQMTFLNSAGVVQFVRNDMEQGNWAQEEYNVNATFPYVDGKEIERGMRVSFRNYATGAMELFEIRNVTNIEPEHYQQIIAEHVAVSELNDEHINTTEITDATAANALATVLTGTLWAVGNSTVTGTQSVDVSRGSVWQAVGAVAHNFNAYVVPRITFNSSGAVTGRYLDIMPAQSVFRGVRLSINKNMSDSSVVYDDSETLTALYGYGGSVDKATSSTNESEELTFKDVVWTQTADHPAKPLNQLYLEDPTATALYGRNGRARFGYYQNGDIKDPELLLQKTWEALQLTSKPKVNISGTVTEFHRLGYTDQPMQLHDAAIVEIQPTGTILQLEIIKLDVDLVDPTATRPEIGAYIPNIIYINREEAQKSGGGGGGRRGQAKEEYEESLFYSGFEKNNQLIAMVVGTKNGDSYIKAAEIALAINDDGSTEALINADHINISATDTVYTLAGDLEHDADGRLVIKNAAGLYVQRNQAVLGVWDKGNLTGGVMVQQINGQSSVKISGDVIDINGSSITISADRIDINGIVSKLLTEQISCASIHTTSGSNLFEGHCSFPDTVNIGDLTMLEGAMTYGAYGVTWQSTTIPTFTFSQTHNFVYRTGGVDYTTSGKIIGTNGTKTIHFLGHPAS